MPGAPIFFRGVCFLAIPVLVALATLVHAQTHEEPSPDLPPIAAAKSEVAKLHDRLGSCTPLRTKLDTVVATMDGENITLRDLLMELHRTHSLAGLPVEWEKTGAMEALARGVTVSEREFLSEVRFHLVGEKPLSESIVLRRLGWKHVSEVIRRHAATRKMLAADGILADTLPMDSFGNGLFVTGWMGSCGTIHAAFRTDTSPMQPPARSIALIRRALRFSELARVLNNWHGTAGAWSVGRGSAADGSAKWVTLMPLHNRWPRVCLPDATGWQWKDGKARRILAFDFLDLTSTARLSSVRYVALSAMPSGRLLFAPADGEVTATRRDGRREQAALQQIADGLARAACLVRDGALVPNSGPWSRMVPGRVSAEEHAPGGIPCLLETVLHGLQGEQVRLQRVFGLHSENGLKAGFPQVGIELRDQITRDEVWRQLLASLSNDDLEKSLRGLARFLAIKKAFAGFLPGQPRGKEPTAPWGAILVDEQEITKRVAGRSRLDMMPLHRDHREVRIEVGIDQIIGPEVPEKSIERVLQNGRPFGSKCRVHVSHILLRQRDGRGEIDPAASRRAADRVFALLKKGESFEALASKYSADEWTRDKGGLLFEYDPMGFRPLLRLDQEIRAAIVKMKSGEVDLVSSARGCHILRVVRENIEPAAMKRAFLDERYWVERQFQRERRSEWLEENVYGKMIFTSRLRTALALTK